MKDLHKSATAAIGLIAAGVFMCLASLFADSLGLGGQSAAMGWKQWLGLLVGLVVGLGGAGLLLWQKKTGASGAEPVWVVSRLEWLGEHWQLALSIALACLIALVAMGLRVQRIANVMPYPGHEDERYLTSRATKIMTTGDFNPHFFNYPSLPIYLTTVGFTAGYMDAARHGEVRTTRDIGALTFPYFEQPRIVWPAKLLFALMSVCAMLFMGVIAYRMYGHPSLIFLSPLILLLSNLYFRQSAQYLNVDIVGAFFVASVYLYLFVSLGQDTMVRRAIVPGVLSGMVIASKYNLLWIIVPCILVVLFYPTEQRAKKIGVLMIAMGLSFLAFSPFILFDYNSFLSSIGIVLSHYGQGHPGHEGDPGLSQLVFYLGGLVRDVGVVTAALVCIGIAATFLKDWKKALILISFPLLLLLLVSAQTTRFHRNIVSVHAFCAIYAAIGIVAAGSLLPRLLERISLFKDRNKFKDAFVALILVGLFVAFLPIQRPLTWAKGEPDSRTLAMEWIESNVPPGSVLIVPKLLSMDTRTLAEDYEILESSFMELNQEEFYALAMGRGAPYVLMPIFSFDSRYRGEEETADRLNSFAEGIEVLHTFPGSRVSVNYRLPVPSGNPQVSIGQLSLTQGERDRIENRTEVDLTTLEGRKKVSDDDTLILPWATTLQSQPLALQEGSYEVVFVTKGTEVEGVNALFEVYLGEDDLVGEFYSQEEYGEDRLAFEYDTDAEIVLRIRYANDESIKDEEGNVIADRNAYIHSITIYRSD